MGLGSLTDDSGGPGCDGCDDKTKETIEKKDPENRTEREQRILDGEEEVPWATGPLSGSGVAYCSLCHNVGQLGAALFGVAGYGLGTHFELGSAVAIGVGVWLVLALLVGYVGHFPVLGPMFGPIVEGMFSGSDKNKEQTTATDGGTASQYDVPTMEDIETEDEEFHFDEDKIDLEAQLEQFQKEINRAYDLANERGEVIREQNEQLANTEDSLEQLEQELEQYEEKIQKEEKEKQNLEQLIAKKAYNGVPGSDAEYVAFRPMNADAMENAEVTGGVLGGPIWIKEVVEYYNKDTNEIHYLGYGVVGDQDKLSQIKDISDTITKSDLDGLEGQLFPDPNNTENLPTHKHPGVKGFDLSEGHRPLFWSPEAGINEARKETHANPDFPYHKYPNILSYDLDNNYAPPPYDSRGFENNQRLREAYDNLKQANQRYQRMVGDKDNKIESQQQQIQSLEQEIEDLKFYKEQYRQNQLKLEDVNRNQRQTRDYQERTMRYQDDKIDQLNEEKETLKEDRDTHRKKALEDAMGTEDVLAQYEQEFDIKADQREAIKILRKGGWQPSQNGHIDLSKLDDPSYEYTYDDVINMALEDPEMSGTLKGRFMKELGLAPEEGSA